MTTRQVGQRHTPPQTDDHSGRHSSLRSQPTRWHPGSGQRVTLPALMQDVQTLSRLGLPETVARTRWMFGFQRRLVFFWTKGRCGRIRAFCRTCHRPQPLEFAPKIRSGIQV